MRTVFLTASTLLLAACTNPAGAPDEAWSYRAAGNEPFWHLRVEEGRARIERPDAAPVERRLVAEEPAGSGRLLRGEGIALHIEHRRCEDDMSGAPYADTVALELDGRTYKGCGGQGLPPERLEQTQWTLTQLRGRAVESETAPSLAIDDKGGVSGSDGCNRISGGFALQADGTVRQRAPGWIATRMACAAPRMQLANDYGAALRAVSRWRFEQADLLLEDEGGAPVLRYRRAY